MSRTVSEYHCLLISPGDVAEERDALTDLANNWNAQIGKALDARVEMVRWEMHGVPDLSGEPQEVLNKQIVDGCDLGIALFWSRLGTATKDHPSGSFEEIQRLLDRGCRVMVYFKQGAIPQRQLDTKQFDALQKIKKDLMKKGIVSTFEDKHDLTQKVQLHLTSVISGLLQKEQADSVSPSVPAVAVQPKPDIRIRVSPAVAALGHHIVHVVGITTENHSPSPFFPQSVTLLMKDGQRMYMPRDGLTEEPQYRRTLQPGDSFTFHITRESLIEANIFPEECECAEVADAIGRTFQSKPESIQGAIRAVLRD